MSENEGGAGDVTDLAGAGGDVLECAPALGEQREPAFAQAAQGALDGVAGAAADVEFTVSGWQLARDVKADAGAVVAGIGEGGQPGGGGPVKGGRAWARAAVMSCTEPGSTVETHSGNPSGASTAWRLPPWV